MRKAKFITIEGGDGSGKSTLLNKIESHLRDLEIAYIRTREPGGTPVAEEIREIIIKPRAGDQSVSPLTELFLYEAARAANVDHVVRPALEAGKFVICDRYTHSTLAYQGYARGLGVELVARLNDAATSGLAPDIVIWLKVAPAEARRRMAGRSDAKDRLESEKDSFHEAVFKAFEEIAGREAKRFIVLDGMKTPGEIFTELLAHPLWKAQVA